MSNLEECAQLKTICYVEKNINFNAEIIDQDTMIRINKNIINFEWNGILREIFNAHDILFRSSNSLCELG